MRDRTRRRVLAEAKSHLASPEELREAPKRVKELEEELRQLELSSEAKNGEERELRYSRLLRLRSLREDFQILRPLEVPRQPNSILLSIVMFVSAFMLCAACIAVVVVGLQLIHQKPDPQATASGFWFDMEQQDYLQLQSTYLSPTLRVQYDQSQFLSQASYADQAFGTVTNAVETKQAGDMNTTANFTYVVTRTLNGRNISYTATLILTFHGGTWGVDDMGAALDPTKAGIPAPATPVPTDTPSAPVQPTDTPTGRIALPRLA